MTYLAAEQVIDFLRSMEVPREGDVPFRRITQEQGNAIAAFLHDRGGYSLFVELDERPGQFDYRYAQGDWHWKLRQARNSCARFFDILNGDPS